MGAGVFAGVGGWVVELYVGLCSLYIAEMRTWFKATLLCCWDVAVGLLLG